jgi:class 3 adenylate cyclase
VGIATSEARAVRSGIRNNNDLIWIGKAPSLAAKLSDLRTYPFAVYISEESYKKLGVQAKEQGNITNIWESTTQNIAGEDCIVYRTKYTRKP